MRLPWGKILFAEIATNGQFNLDFDKLYCDTTGYIIGSESKFLVGILNSKVITFFFSKISSEIRGGFLRWKRQYVELIPIPVKGSEQIELLVDEVIKMKKSSSDADTGALEAQIDQLVYGLFGLTAEEIGIVEGVGNNLHR